LFRRFDDVIHYDLPDDDQIRRLFEFKLEGYTDNDICVPEVVEASRDLSHAELSLVCDDAIKESLLYGTAISSVTIISLLAERHRIYQGREA
jgi:SpoVK/Ycf46/Vps4 family AAA+-type ATPase